MMALNAKMKIRLWTPNGKGDLDVELEVNNDFERLTEDTTLNTKMKKRLCMPNRKWITTLNVKMNMWL